jgi:hypothetical protein
MSKTPVQRIAFVRLSPKGKSYAMRCDREDLIEGDEVEVLMYAGTKKEYYDDGEITSISHQRWNCSCNVINHICEVNYSFSDKALVRSIVEKSSKSKIEIETWRSQKKPYLESLESSVKNDMQEIYNAIAPENGENAYLGDGIWIKADGTTEDEVSQREGHQL